jgi:NhaA family Na+:H+ antiporter
VFYTSKLSLGALAFAAGCVVVLAMGNRLGVRRTAFYTLLGLALWVAVLKSGVHATIAGVLLAMTIPARRRIDRAAFTTRARALVEEFAAGDDRAGATDLTTRQMHVVHSLEHACEGVTQPLHRFEAALYPWVGLLVMPLFAFANAGVAVDAATARGASGDAASIGIFLGLLVGKQLGVFSFAWLAARAGLARLPAGATWAQLYGIAWLCGIGFTMSLFIAGLAFTSPQVLDHAKLAILSASTLSALVGATVLALTGRRAHVGARPDPLPDAV